MSDGEQLVAMRSELTAVFMRRVCAHISNGGVKRKNKTVFYVTRVCKEQCSADQSQWRQSRLRWKLRKRRLLPKDSLPPTSVRVAVGACAGCAQIASKNIEWGLSICDKRREEWGWGWGTLNWHFQHQGCRAWREGERRGCVGLDRHSPWTCVENAPSWRGGPSA